MTLDQFLQVYLPQAIYANPPILAKDLKLSLSFMHTGLDRLVARHEYDWKARLALAHTATQIIEWVVLRWKVEVTFHEVRKHRQWSDLAILHMAQALLGLFSVAMFFAHQLPEGQSLPVQQNTSPLR